VVIKSIILLDQMRIVDFILFFDKLEYLLIEVNL